MRSHTYAARHQRFAVRQGKDSVVAMGLAPDTLSQVPSRGRLVMTFVVILVLVRLWLGAGQTVAALGTAAHDDAHFILLASSLLSGEWLGPYNEFTLIKGPFYPMWISAAFISGIPLLFAEHALYVVSCGTFVRALSPALQSAGVRVMLLAVLLFNPASFAAGVMSRVIRESIYSSLTLLVLGTALGLALRQDRPFRAVLPWALGLGISLAGYFLCREERIWLLPSLVVLLAGAYGRRSSAWRAGLRLVGVALAVFTVLVGTVVLKNGLKYGAFVVTELTEGPFVTAYRTVVSVRHEKQRPYVPLPAEARKRIYEVSPRFAELAPYVEGEAGRGWSAPGCSRLGVCDEIAGGWMLWALRAAAATAGHYTTGREAARYWTEVATEVGQACDDGRLACEAKGFSFMPPLKRVDSKALSQALERAPLNAVVFRGVTFQPHPSKGSIKQLKPFLDITRTRLAPDPRLIRKRLPHQDRLLARKNKLFRWNLAVYRATTPLLACAALLAFGMSVVSAISHRHAGGSLLAAGTLLVGALSRVTLLALVDATSFPTIETVGYLAPVHALLLGFVVLAFHAVVAAVRKRRPGRTVLR
jgi:hypothetical protein